MVESNKTIREVRQTYAKNRAKVRRERKAQLGRVGATESIAAIKKWKMKCDRERKHVTVAAIRKFHSVLIEVEVKQGGEWMTVVVIADSGSGITIFRMVDVETAVAEYGMQPPCEGLVTADGNKLKGLCGQCAAIMRFKGHTKEHTVTTQVIENTRMTPIMGMDFWKPHNAVFDLKNNHITIETEEEDGSITQEVIRCWCHDTKAETQAAVLSEHLSEVQEARQWSQRNAHQVSAVQAASIQSEESELQKQILDIERLMSSDNVTTTCRATEDMLIPPGH